MDPKSLFSLSAHLDALSRESDPLEVLQETVDFEYFRAWLVEGLGYGDGSKGGRPPFDPVMIDVLDVWSRDLMVHYFHESGRRHYGLGSPRERHNDSGSPSSDTA